jgi:tRNA (mo5U34)-methyltransferase
MLQFHNFFQTLAENEALQDWATRLPEQINQKLADAKHGHLQDWFDLLANLPILPTEQYHLDQPAVTVSSHINETQRQALYTTLQRLTPWRKGPFNIHGVEIDAEWRSDQKWARVAPHIDLDQRTVLDVGCGNGYYAWRMLGAGARCVLGIDPTLSHVIQFQVIQHFMGEQPLAVVPLGIEDLPPRLQAFDTVFSMGVFYHRRSPFDHLIELRDCLATNGTLVLETLLIEGEMGEALVPAGRYAKMRNVWFIPTEQTLIQWLKRAGFRDVRCVDLCHTTPAEQRATDWMHFESLQDFLDPDDAQRTIEGLPAPYRGTFIATK